MVKEVHEELEEEVNEESKENLEEKVEITPNTNKNKFFIYCALALVITIIVSTILALIIPLEDVKDESYFEGMAMYVIKENLKDPDSAEFLQTGVELINDGEDGAIVAVKVRAKNSFNAYTIGRYLVEFDKYDNYKIIPVENP